MTTLVISSNYLSKFKESVQDAYDNMCDQVQGVSQDLEITFTNMQNRVASLFGYVQETAAKPKQELYNRAVVIVTHPIFKQVTSGVHAVRMTLLIMTFGIVDLLRLPIFLARITSGIAHILNAHKKIEVDPFTQTQKSALEKKVNELLTPQQKQIAIGAGIIARGVLEAFCLPAAMACAIYDGME